MKKNLANTKIYFLLGFCCIFLFVTGFFLLNRKPEIHVFIHTCTIGNWGEVLDRQLGRIETSGLYNACNSISLGVLGAGDLTPFKERYPKLKILFQNPDTSLYERPTILSLHHLATSKPNALLMYIHTKGVTKQDNPNVTDWSKYMEYFVIDRWQDCVAALKEHDVCGVNWRFAIDPNQKGDPHFSGNFWWATSNYVSTLPGHIGPSYWAPEMWLGQNSPKVKNFHESGIRHYDFPYPESNYVYSTPLPIEQKSAEYEYFDKLALAAGTDISSAWHNYTKVYADYFSPLKNKPLTFLQIGIYRGNSVALWENYFVNGDLHFIDIYSNNIWYSPKRAHFHFIDQTDSKALKAFAETIKSGFDIIIDDGGHEMNQQIISFESLFPFVKSGGYYVIEDLHTSYWQSHGGGGSFENPKSGPHTCIGFLHNLIDDLNYTSARTQSADPKKVPIDLRQTLNIYQDQIYSITFYKSLCIIQKK